MHPFGDDAFKASTFLAKVIWDSIGEIVHAATDAMAWLQASRVASSEGLPSAGTPRSTSLCFRHKATKPFRVDTKLLGSVIQPTLYKETGKIDKNRQSNGISPNFVHSIDAAHEDYVTLPSSVKSTACLWCMTATALMRRCRVDVVVSPQSLR